MRVFAHSVVILIRLLAGEAIMAYGKKYYIIFGSILVAALISASLIYGAANKGESDITFNSQVINPAFAPSQAATFALVGDLGCGTNANQTLAQIGATAPAIDRLVLLGDYSYQNGWQCFQKQLIGQGVDNKVHGPGNSFKGVVVGNHEYNNGGSDHLNSAGRTDFTNYFGLINQNGVNNYSFDYGDVHFTVLDSGGETGQATFGVGTKAYQFLLEDLRKSAENPTIDWRIVVLHKNAYSSPNSGHNSNAAIRDAIHPLLDLYNVDLVIYGHTHVYERTYPIKYNYGNGGSPVKTSTGTGSTYTDPEGQIFLTVGQGGKSHYKFTGLQPSWVAFRDNSTNGFLKVAISEDGQTLSGNYLKSSDGTSMDLFSISKSASGLKYDYAPYRTFNGVSDYFDPPVVTDMSISGSFTVNAWFKTTKNNSAGVEEMVVNKGGDGSDSAGQNMNYGIFITDAEKVEAGFEDANTSNNDHFVVSSASYNDGNWHMATVTYDSQTGAITLYVDGTSVGTDTSALPPETNSKPLRIGANSRANDSYFNGQIDEVQVIRKALGANEVADIYNHTAPFSESFG